MQRSVAEEDAVTGLEPVADGRTQEHAEGREAGNPGGIGLTFPRAFTVPGANVFDEVAWEKRSAVITNEQGEAVFEQRDVEIPSFWSQQATNIVVSKYFRGQVGTPDREQSVRAAHRPGGARRSPAGRASRSTSPTRPRWRPSATT